MTPEGKIENYLRNQVKKHHGQIRKVRWIGRRGAPDDIIWWPGPRFAFVEVKAPGQKPTKQQLREHDRMIRDGFKVFVVDSFESVDAIILLLTQADSCE